MPDENNSLFSFITLYRDIRLFHPEIGTAALSEKLIVCLATKVSFFCLNFFLTYAKKKDQNFISHLGNPDRLDNAFEEIEYGFVG